jgi:hypothetical protein
MVFSGTTGVDKRHDLLITPFQLELFPLSTIRSPTIIPLPEQPHVQPSAARGPCHRRSAGGNHGRTFLRCWLRKTSPRLAKCVPGLPSVFDRARHRRCSSCDNRLYLVCAADDGSGLTIDPSTPARAGPGQIGRAETFTLQLGACAGNEAIANRSSRDKASTTASRNGPRTSESCGAAAHMTEYEFFGRRLTGPPLARLVARSRQLTGL